MNQFDEPNPTSQKSSIDKLVAIMMRRTAQSLLMVAVAFAFIVAIDLEARRGSAPDPLVREGVTEKIGDHTYVIPDATVSLVPNVGIVVGLRATLVIDPGSITDNEWYGRRS